MNPLLSIDYLVIIACLLLGVTGFLCWRASAALGWFYRSLLTLLRLCAMAGVILILCNPGHWNKIETNKTELAVLLDRSASMAVKDNGKSSRWDEICSAVNTAAGNHEKGKAAIKIYTFSDKLERVLTLSELKRQKLLPDGKSTDINLACASVLDYSKAAGTDLRGILICSDGRQVGPDCGQDFISDARARSIPIYACPVGGKIMINEFQLEVPRYHFMTFAGQNLQIPVKIKNLNMGNRIVTLVLRDASGKTVQTLKAATADNSEAIAEFKFAPAHNGLAAYTIGIISDKDSRLLNQTQVGVTVIREKLRVLLLEGRPSWDIKFLAQALRLSSNIILTTVHRVSSDNFFTVKTGDNEKGIAADAIIPDNPKQLSEYNLIIIGKGAEYFFPPAKVAVLQQYLTEFGGALLLARGKPYAGKLPAFEELEPVVWGTAISDKFRWIPLQDAGSSEQFSSYLPSAGSKIWQQLPPLSTANYCTTLKTFAQVLIQGESVSARHPFPALIARSTGKGVVAVVNSDGLWQWSFRPTTPESEKFYREFWMQLTLWLAKYGDFLPGQDFTMKLDQTAINCNEPVAVRIFSRFQGSKATGVSLKVFSGGRQIQEIPASKINDDNEAWKAMLNFSEPGFYHVQLSVKDIPSAGEIGRIVYVRPRSDESDNLSADRDFLSRLTLRADGRILDANELSSFFAESGQADIETAMTQGEWQTTWDVWPLLVIILACLGTEIFIRRRNGLL